MTKLTRKLLISVFTLAFALVTLGATTFAWFTLSTTADIDPINVTVTSGEGIELSTTGITYKNNIDISDITAQIGSLPIFDAVTSQDGSTMTDIANAPVAVNGSYLEFNLWVRSPSKNGLVYLLPHSEEAAGTYIGSDGKSWTPDIPFTYSKYGTISTATPITVYGANALRFSFEEYISGFTVKKTSGDLTVFELNPYDSTAASRNTILGNVTKTDGLLSYFSNKLEQANNPLYGKTPTIATSVSNDSLGLNASEVPINSISTLDIFTPKDVENDPNTSIDGYYYGYLKVRLWLEGWDPDSFDAILGSPIKVVLKFAVVSPGSEPTGVTLETPEEITTGDNQIALSTKLQFNATVQPSTANQRVTWSVTGNATIDQNGLLTVNGLGSITVKATSYALNTEIAEYTFNVIE